MDYVIMTDTSANLPRELILKGQLSVVSYTLCLDGKELPSPCESEFDGHAFYDGMRAGKPVTTAQVNTTQFVDAMDPLLAEGKDILFIGMSSGISGSHHSAELAASEMRERYPGRKIYTVDTLGASLGEGMWVIEAMRWREAGLSIDEAAARLDVLRHKMYQIFTVDDLRYLHRGGRLSGAATLLGTALGIKPLLKGDPEGKIVSSGKCRGRKRAIELLAERYDRLVEAPEDQTVCIAHADCADDAAYLIQLLNKNHPPREILTVMYEPVTGCHVGPGTLALFFIGKDGCRTVDG